MMEMYIIVSKTSKDYHEVLRNLAYDVNELMKRGYEPSGERDIREKIVDFETYYSVSQAMVKKN